MAESGPPRSGAGPAPVLTDSDIVRVLSLSIVAGAISPKYADTPILKVIDLMAQVASTANYSLLPDDLMNYFGTSPGDIKFLYGMTGGPQPLGQTMATVAFQAQPYLWHKENTPIVVPLYAALTIMTAIAISLRLWSRHQVAGGLRAFDGLAVLGFVLTLIYGGIAVHHSEIEGRWMFYYDKTWNQIRNSSKFSFILNVIYPWAMMAIKGSLLLFYYSMTKFNWVHWSCYAIGAVTVLNTVGAFITPFVACHHVDYWNHRLNPRECRIDTAKALIAYASVYMATDLAIWILPMPLVFQLKLQTTQKILAIVTFSLGGIACIASALRIWSITQAQNYTSKSSSTLLIDVWTIIELNLALICASAPAVRALIIYYAPKVMNSLQSAGFTMNDDKDSDKSVSQEKVKEKV